MGIKRNRARTQRGTNPRRRPTPRGVAAKSLVVAESAIRAHQVAAMTVVAWARGFVVTKATIDPVGVELACSDASLDETAAEENRIEAEMNRIKGGAFFARSLLDNSIGDVFGAAGMQVTISDTASPEEEVRLDPGVEEARAMCIEDARAILSPLAWQWYELAEKLSERRTLAASEIEEVLGPLPVAGETRAEREAPAKERGAS